MVLVLVIALACALAIKIPLALDYEELIEAGLVEEKHLNDLSTSFYKGFLRNNFFDSPRLAKKVYKSGRPQWTNLHAFRRTNGEISGFDDLVRVAQLLQVQMANFERFSSVSLLYPPRLFFTKHNGHMTHRLKCSLHPEFEHISHMNLKFGYLLTVHANYNRQLKRTGKTATDIFQGTFSEMMRRFPYGQVEVMKSTAIQNISYLSVTSNLARIESDRLAVFYTNRKNDLRPIAQFELSLPLVPILKDELRAKLLAVCTLTVRYIQSNEPDFFANNHITWHFETYTKIIHRITSYFEAFEQTLL